MRMKKKLKEAKYLENIKEIIEMLPTNHKLQENVADYMKNGMDKYEAIQTIRDSLSGKMIGIEKCIQWDFARNQRKTKLVKSRGLESTRDYEIIDCYPCNGYNFKCKSYHVKDRLKELVDKYRTMRA